MARAGPHAMTSIWSSVFFRLCEESCPVMPCKTRILEYHGEKRGDLYYTKPMLLAVAKNMKRKLPRIGIGRKIR